MNQIEYAWNDVNFNEELNPVIPLMFRDPVTDNPVKFNVVDELTWTITFDNTADSASDTTWAGSDAPHGNKLAQTAEISISEYPVNLQTFQVGNNEQ